MRDGVRLYTSVYSPKDQAKTYPFLLERTPYSCAPYGIDRYKGRLGPTAEFEKSGYIFVYQDVRGRYMSEGVHVYSPPHNPNKTGTQHDESSDTYDTIEWLLANVPNNNGKVGTIGISQPGFYATNSLLCGHPALVASSPQAPVTDRFIGDDDHHNGAYFFAQRLSFMNGFGAPRAKPTPNSGSMVRFSQNDGYRFFLELGMLTGVNEKYFNHQNKFWDQVMAHPNYDEFWQSRGMRQYLKNIKPAVFVVGGWYDAEDLWGALNTYGSIESQSPGNQNFIMMGPWSHGSWSGLDGTKLFGTDFGLNPNEKYRAAVFSFFEHYLKDQPLSNFHEATMFQTGANLWRTFDSWPPKGTQTVSFALRDHGKIQVDPQDAVASRYDEYTSDPNKPVPYIGEMAAFMNPAYMLYDQRFASTRPDVLVYQTNALQSDLTLAGPLQAQLWISSSGTDADIIVKVVDVSPADATPIASRGAQMLVRAEVMRAKYRNSFTFPEALVPNQLAQLNFKLNDVLHTFKKGHKVMIQIQSSWFPLVDRNPQRFMNINQAWPADVRKENIRVFFGGETPSNVTALKL